MKNIQIKTILFSLAVFILSNTLTGQSFRHTAAGGNISGHITYLDHALTNNLPNKLLFVSQEWGSAGPYNPHTVGVWYSNNKWTVFNQDFAAMPQQAKFNVLALDPGERVFVHTASNATISGHITTINHPLLNNNPNARILLTQNWGNAGPYNKNAVGIYYTGSRWAIYNQNRVAMPANAKFNIWIDDRIFVVSASTPTTNWFVFDNPATNNQPNALVFATQYWTSVYNTHEIGSWYTNNKWSIFNQDRATMPANAKFFVYVAGASAPVPTTCVTIPRNQWFDPLNRILATAGVRVNNYTSRQNEFNPTGERAFLRPGDCYFSVSGIRLPFSIDMVEGGPDNRCKAYINDWNSRSAISSIRSGRLLVRLDFENAGTELVTNCYNNGCCEGNPFCPGAGCPDYELNNAWIEINLLPIVSGGRLTYSSEVGFNVDVRELGPDPCTNNFWAFLCDWGIIPRVGDRQNRIRQAIESNLRAQIDSPQVRGAIEVALNSAAAGVDFSRCTRVSIDASGNLVFN